MVLVSNMEDTDWTVTKWTGEKLYLSNACGGKRLYVWRRRNFLALQCTDVEQQEATVAMHRAAEEGGGTTAVRDRLKAAMELYGFDAHFLTVASDDDSDFAFTARLITSCWMSVTSHGYRMNVYKKTQEKFG